MQSLWFFFGTIFGSVIGFGTMALFQIGRISEYEDQIYMLDTKSTRKGVNQNE